MPQEHPDNEKELLLLVSQGNEKAFNELVRLYHAKVFFHALAFVKLVSDAEEITQDIFMKVWQQREKLPDLHDFRNFLFILGRNSIISAIRKRAADTAPAHQQENDDVLRPDEQYELKEITALVLRGIEHLSPQQQRVFRMSRLEHKNHEEIAQALAISKHAVNWHMVKALNFLRLYIGLQKKV